MWAPWCQPCLEEITEISQHESELSDAGIRVVAVTLNDADSDEQIASAKSAQTLLRNRGFPFDGGTMPELSFDLLQTVHDSLFGWRAPLRIPTSFLCDASGQLAVVYQGRLDLPQLMEDASALRRSDSVRGFAGRWMRRPPRRNLSQLAERILAKGHLVAARDYLKSNEASIERGENAAKIHGQLGLAFLEQGRLEDAVEQFQIALSIDAATPVLYVGWAEVLTAQGEFERALEQLETAKRLAPDHLGARIKTAELLRKLGRMKPAIKEYEAALRLDAHDSTAWHNLGVALVMDARPAAASNCFARSLAIQPDNANAYTNLAMVQAKLGQTEKAVESLQAAIRLRPKTPSSHNNLGGLLAQLGKLEDAERHFTLAVRLAPHNAKYRRNLAAVRSRRQTRTVAP